MKLLDAKLIRGFTELFLLSRYDTPKPIPDFHMELWEDCCSDDPWVADAAPRGHAKSTAVTHAFTLCVALFRERDHILIVSDTEKQAIDFLGDIRAELTENEALREQFDIKRFIKETETEIIVEFTDGEKFRILVKGSEQKVRGIKWRGKRPNMIIGDDLENDESVMNPDRREKFRNWFQNALLPCGSDDCLVRIVGTILHLDSQLNRILGSESWRTRIFAAHNHDFSEILWPEKFSKQRLLRIRKGYENEGNLDGYNQEYLNNPVAEENAYFRPQDFIPMSPDDHQTYKVYVAAADFAISETERADYTVIMVAGIDENGLIHVVDVRRGRFDAKEIIDELLSIGRRYNPDPFIFETEKIDKAIGPFLDDAMRKQGIFLNIVKKTPTKSKTTRGRSIQAMMRSGSVRFDKDADWYPSLYSELMTMTNAGGKGKHDDCFPGNTPIITRDGIKPIKEVTTKDFVLTRKGYKRVLKSWCKGEKEVITRFGITATPEHRIFTQNRGWVSLDSITYDDILIKSSSNGERKCAKRSHSMAGIITGILKRAKATIESITRVTTNGNRLQESCIEIYGNIITEPYQKDFMCTTLMETITITPSKILNVSRGENIMKNIDKKLLKGESQNERLKILTEPDIWRMNGIKAMKAGNGIENMLKRVCSKISLKSHVKAAIKYLSQNWLFINIARENAKTNITPENSGKRKELVYDLMIEDQHEFFANGILVHNCFDAFAYIGMGVDLYHEAPTVRELEDEAWEEEHEYEDFGVSMVTGY